MADPCVNILSLYTGTGMLDCGVGLALEWLGFAHRVLGYVEREACAAALLLDRMEKSTLPLAPVWCADLAGLDARPFRGLVDLLIASPPCQPYSAAGKQLGNDDERSFGDGAGPLTHTIRIIDESRPAVVIFENVPRWVTGGAFRRFGEALAGLGYEIEDPLFLASGDLGAPHRRERVFIMAHAAFSHWKPWPERNRVRPPGARLDDAERTRPRAGTPRVEGCTRRGRDRLADASDGLGDADEAGRRSDESGRRSDRRTVVGRSDATLADTCGTRREGPERRRASTGEGASARGSTAQLGSDVGNAGLHEHERGPSQERPPIGSRDDTTPDESAPRLGALPLVPPGRNDFRSWAAVAGVDASLMPSVEPEVSGVADALAPVSDSLRLGGNGVDPLVCAVAFAVLWRDGGTA